MKNRFCAALLLAAFCVTLFTGCASVNALSQPAAVPAATETPLASEVPAASVQEEPTYLTKEEARDIALQHAGLSVSDVSRLHIEFDRDDRRPEYDIDFRYNGYEYDYEIHAETGKILKSEKERDD